MIESCNFRLKQHGEPGDPKQHIPPYSKTVLKHMTVHSQCILYTKWVTPWNPFTNRVLGEVILYAYGFVKSKGFFWHSLMSDSKNVCWQKIRFKTPLVSYIQRKIWGCYADSASIMAELDCVSRLWVEDELPRWLWMEDELQRIRILFRAADRQLLE